MCKQSGSRLACGLVLMLECFIDMHFIKHKSFTGQRADHKFLVRPERVFGKNSCAHAVLVSDKHFVIVQRGSDAGKVRNHAFHKMDLVQRVELVIRWLLLQDHSVAIQE